MKSETKLWTQADENYGKAQAFKQVASELRRLATTHPEAEGLLAALEAQIWEWKDQADARRVEAEAQLGLCSNLTSVKVS